MMTERARHGTEQKKAEKWLVKALSEKLQTTLSKTRWTLEGGSWIEVDGFSISPKVLCELLVHIGPLSGSQKHKAMIDALKLLFADTLTKGKGKLVLLFACHRAAAYFQGNSWMARFLQTYGIQIEVINLPKRLKNEVERAQKR